MPTPIVTLPGATTTIAYLQPWSDAMFGALLAIAVVVAGLIIGGLVVAYLAGGVKSAAAKVVGRGRGGKRRRR